VPASSDSKPATPPGAHPHAGSPSADAARPQWKKTLGSAWQLPALAGGVLLLIGGVSYAFLTRPKPDPLIDFRVAESQMKSGEYAEAVATLSERVLPLLNKGVLDEEARRGFHLMRARGLYLGQREKGIDRKENHENIKSEYLRAEVAGAKLEPQDHLYMSRTLLALDQLPEAAMRLDELPKEFEAQKLEVQKDLVEAAIAKGREGEQVALTLLTELTARTDLDGQTRLWAVSRQAELALAQGYTEEAATRLLRTLPRVMEEADPVLKGQTLLTLAKAYIAQGDDAGASQHLDTAIDILPDSSSVKADVLTLRGQLAQRLDQIDIAANCFQRVIEEHEITGRLLEAMLGLSEVEFHKDQLESPTSPPERALEMYQRVVDDFAIEEKQTLDRETLRESIMARCRERAEVEDWRSALALSSMARSLYRGDAAQAELPPEILLAQAQSQRRIAEDLLVSSDGGVRELSQADPATQREARELLLAAGEHFREYAERVVKDDTGDYADSLWSSAECFNRAGDMEEAISSYLQFATDFPSDARAMEAKFRLAEAYRARGDLKPAEAQYRDLLAARDSAGRSGPYADASYVPLAQTLLADESADNDGEAEKLLLQALSGRVGGVGTPAYRGALRELGDYYHRTGKHEAAIERYEEYLQRVEAASRSDDVAAAREWRDSPLVRYRLADSYRLSARGIDKTLMGALPDSDQRALRATRTQRLNRAFDQYGRVTDELERRDRRGSLEDVAMRNSFFFRGDCAFELADFEEAIRQYDAARERYPRDPASLVALTQVVSALIEKDELDKARVANEKARKFYESLPESAWDDPALPMGKREWERWLASQSRLIDRPQQQQAEATDGDR
jgi:tetratricopeptide (TPR) repeat protein